MMALRFESLEDAVDHYRANGVTLDDILDAVATGDILVDGFDGRGAVGLAFAGYARGMAIAVPWLHCGWGKPWPEA